MHKRLAILLFTALLFCMTPLAAVADWSVPVNLSDSANDVTDVTLAVDAAGLVHAVWSEEGMLYHNVKMGSIWSSASQVASGWEPHLLADQDAGLHLVYSAQPEASQEVFYARMMAPAGWNLPSNLSQSENNSSTPAIALDSAGNLTVVWSESTSSGALVFVAESPDGAQWSTSPLPQAAGTSPQAAYGPDDALTVVWEDVFDLGFPLEIMAATKKGAGWTLPEDVSYTVMSQSQAPALAANDQAVWLAWEETTQDGSAIYAARLGDDGWSDWTEVTTPGDRHLPMLAFDGSGLGHMAWIDGLTIDGATLPVGAEVWQAAAEIASTGEELSGLALAAVDDLQVAWLAGEQGVDRDAWVSGWSAATEETYQVVVPLVLK